MNARIIVEVSGGVAEVVHSTSPIEVHFFDWDNIKEGDTPAVVNLNGIQHRDFDLILEANHRIAKLENEKHQTKTNEHNR